MTRWRRANPERAREQSRQNYARNGAGWDRYRVVVPYEPVPVLHLGDPLFEQARVIVPDSAYEWRSITHDPLNEDLRSEAVLAMLEGRDPSEAVQLFRSAENGWRAMTASTGLTRVILSGDTNPRNGSRGGKVFRQER